MGAIIVPGSDPLEQLFQGLQRGVEGTLPTTLQNLHAQQQQQEQEKRREKLMIQMGIIPDPAEALADDTPQPRELEERQPDAPQPIDQPKPNALQKKSDQELLQMEVSGDKFLAQVAKAEKSRRNFDIKERELTQKGFVEDRKSAEKITVPFLTNIDKQRSGVREKEQAVRLMRDSIQEQDLDFWSKDNFNRFLGRFGGALRTAKGQQLINAQKEFLLGNIQRAGSRPNQWIEQQIATMLPQIGISREANLTVTEILEHETAVQRMEQQVADELAAQDRQDYGFVQPDIAARVDKRIEETGQDLQDRLAYRLREVHEREKSGDDLLKLSTKKVKRGTFLTPRMAAAMLSKNPNEEQMKKNARKMGYVIPNSDQINRWRSEL